MDKTLSRVGLKWQSERLIHANTLHVYTGLDRSYNFNASVPCGTHVIKRVS